MEKVREERNGTARAKLCPEAMKTRDRPVNRAINLKVLRSRVL